MELTVNNFFSHLIFHPYAASTKKERVIAAMISIALCIFGGLIHLFCALRNCLMGRATRSNPPHVAVQQTTDRVGTRTIAPSPAPTAAPVYMQTIPIAPRHHLAAAIGRMGAHLHSYQKQTIIALFNQAMLTPHPKQKFQELIDANINTPEGWGRDKASHIKANILPFMPEYSSNPVSEPAIPIHSTIVPTHSEPRIVVEPTTAPLPPPPTVAVPADPLTDLQHQLNLTIAHMGAHLHPFQQELIRTLVAEAMRSFHPRHELETLIDNRINVAGGWGEAKADHIKTNILPLLPEVNATAVPQTMQRGSISVSDPLAITLTAIAEQPIDPQGNTLVCFYKTGPTAFLGNFSICPNGIILWGERFRCSEAAFQWRKYQLAAQQNNHTLMANDPKMREFFTCEGEQAFQLSRYFDNSYRGVYVTGWITGVRDTVMWEVLKAKFNQNSSLNKLLALTKTAYLLEHNQVKGRDLHWSDNYDGSGENMLGRMLMAIRAGIRSDAPIPYTDHDKARILAGALFANRNGLSYSIF